MTDPAAPACCGYPMHRHGTVDRILANGSTTTGQRYHCSVCGQTTRVLPDGVAWGSKVTDAEVVLMRRLRDRGHTVREVAEILNGRGVQVSAATVQRLTKGEGS